MKSLFLTLSLLLAAPAFGEVVKFDTSKTMVEQFHETKHTIVYIGEDWCPYCQRAKKILSEAAVKHADKLHIVFLETDKLEAGQVARVGDEGLLQTLRQLQGIPQFVVVSPSKNIRQAGNGDPAEIVRQLLAP